MVALATVDFELDVSATQLGLYSIELKLLPRTAPQPKKLGKVLCRLKRG